MDSRRPAQGLAHVSGVTRPPLITKTIPQVLRETVTAFADRPALVFSATGQRWTWAEFAAEVDALAAGLLALGLRRGDRVGIWSPNRPEWVLTQFATARLGIILVNINPAYRLAELEYALNKVGCRALITAERFKTSDYLEMLSSLMPELSSAAGGPLRAARFPQLEFVIKMGAAPIVGMLRLDDVVAGGQAIGAEQLDAVTASLDIDDAINIQFTSGTTGAPKGATLSHRNIVNNAFFVVSGMRFTQADRLCIPVPLYHCFGMVLGTLGCVTVGATMVFPGEGFDAQATLSAVSEESCTAVYGVPSMFSLMLDAPNLDRFKLGSLRTGVMAGALCPIELMKRVVADMNMREVTICYGMTETSPVSFQSATDDPIERRVSTIGRIQPHVEVKIVGPDGATLPVGQQGEICTRGYSVMKGYWDDPQRTAESIVDGWMHSGDLGVIDEEGYATVVGRSKDMVIRGGENIYPREIEEFLGGFSKVREVQVFGVPDEKYGEELCAWIVCRDGCVASEEEIREFCRDKIAHFKVPRYIRFKTELPMTATGKAQKFKMRDEMIKELDA